MNTEQTDQLIGALFPSPYGEEVLKAEWIGIDGSEAVFDVSVPLRGRAFESLRGSNDCKTDR